MDAPTASLLALPPRALTLPPSSRRGPRARLHTMPHTHTPPSSTHSFPPFPPQKTKQKQNSIDFKIKKVLLDGAWAKLQVWDTAGQERFRTITAAYYRGAGGVLLVYDVGDAASFASVRNWLRGIDQHAADGVVKVREENNNERWDGNGMERSDKTTRRTSGAGQSGGASPISQDASF